MAVRQQKWAQLTAIPEQQLSIFVFSKNTADSRLKIVDKREILVDGKLYDVVRKIDDGQQIKYFCVYDHEEESLISKTRLFNSKAQQMPLQGTARNIINLIIKTGIFSEKPSLISEYTMLVYSNYPETNYSVPAIQISPPPPKNIC